MGVDAMNAALNPGSSATSALGAVGREGEMREVADVLVEKISNAMGPLAETVAAGFRQHQAAIEAVASGMTETKRKIRKQAAASERHNEKLKKQRTELGVVKRKLVDKERQDKNFDRAYQENWDAVQMEFTQIQKHNKVITRSSRSLPGDWGTGSSTNPK